MNMKSTRAAFSITLLLCLFAYVLFEARYADFVVGDSLSLPAATLPLPAFRNNSKHFCVNSTLTKTLGPVGGVQNFGPPFPPRNAVKFLYLLGERNSGTNYLLNVLKAGLHTSYNISDVAPGVGYKHLFFHHGFGSEVLERIRRQTSSLWVMAVRSPCDWADGMYRKPWHMCDPKNASACPLGKTYLEKGEKFLKGVSRKEFFELPWLDSREAHTHSDNNFTYKDVFTLREHKLSMLAQIVTTVPDRTVIAHLKLVELNPQHFIDNLVRQFALRPKETEATPWILKPSEHQHSVTCLSDEEWLISQHRINWERENQFGFGPLDCVRCI